MSKPAPKPKPPSSPPPIVAVDRFRSPLLRPPSSAAGPSLGRRALFRCLGALLVVLVLAAVAVPLRRHTLSSEGPEQWLLWLHDHLYLPVKGYTFTLGFPLSLTWCLALLLLLVLAVIGFLLARPLTLPLHIHLIRLALQRPRLSRLLLGWCRKPAFGRLHLDRFGTGLLMTVVEHDRSAVLADLDSGEHADRGAEPIAALAEAGRLSAFAARVWAGRARTGFELLAAVSLVHHALLRFELLAAKAWSSEPAGPGSGQGSGHDPEQSSDQSSTQSTPAGLRQQLEAIASAMLVRLCPDPGKLPPASGGAPAVLGVVALAADLGCLIGVDHPQWPAPEEQMRALLDRAQARRLLVDSLRQQVEQVLPYSIFSRPSQAPAELGSESLHPIAAQLALDVALGLAIRRQVPELVLATIESLEALRFNLLAAGPERVVQALGSAPAAAFAATLCHGLPRTTDYRICALLLNRQVAAAGDLKQARARASKVLLREDIELIRARINLLLAAAADPRRALTTSGWEAE